MENQLAYRISSERAIENLQAQYTHLLDQGNLAGVAALFAKGRLVSLGEVIEGAEAVEQLLRRNLQIYADGTPRTAHVTTNTVLHIGEQEETATAVSYLTIFQQDQDRDFPLQPIMIGRYADRFARTAGEWHFTERELSLTLLGDLSHHASAASQANL
jgi:hypothetical protein